MPDPKVEHVSLPSGYVEVATRYADVRHVAESGLLARATGQLLTLCLGTPAWTIASWKAVPDHPVLSPEQMFRQPMCGYCAGFIRGGEASDE